MRESHRKMVNHVMAIASIFLLIVFFIPSHGNNSRSMMAGKSVATVYDGEKISIGEDNELKEEWDIVRHHLYKKGVKDNQEIPFARFLGQENVLAIDNNPKSFELLVLEAQHLGVGVSNDLLQDALHNGVANMPDETDDNYEQYLQAVRDLLSVKNLLDRVGDMVKISSPRALRALAMTEQDESINIVEFPVSHFASAATTQPSEQDIEIQYDRYCQTLPGQTVAGSSNAVVSPLGFGYLLPNRVKVQYIGFTHAAIIDAIKNAPPPTGNQFDVWDSLAERAYREHWKDFVPDAVSPPDWSALAPAITDKVYASLYESYAGDLNRKVYDRITEQVAADWQAYHDAVSKGQPAPASSQGVPFDSNDYLRLFAASIQHDFGVTPVLGIEDQLMGPAELNRLPDIGAASDGAGHSFGQIATVAGDQFQSAATLPDSEKLSMWQPSPPIFSGTAQDPTGIFIFRLSAMDPSHTAKLEDVRNQVIQDIRTQAAWDAAVAQADNILTAAKNGSGLIDAAEHHQPPLEVSTTDFFNAAEVMAGKATMPTVHLSAASIAQLASAARDLLSTPAAEGRPVSEVELPADHEVAVIELQNTRADWMDQSELTMRQSIISAQAQAELAERMEAAWAVFDSVSKRVNYQELTKQD
ncbi:MAG TPA: hypothetical protein VL992_11905 [Tepidisphaeraceae bacterium]|nr:hypothetical protein [Tepidisphaeraceae bacterium]